MRTQNMALLCVILLLSPGSAPGGEKKTLKLSLTIDRGPDLGQCFGTLFEATSDDGSLVLGAGFQNGYNTQSRADRHGLQFFIRPKDGKRTFTIEKLPRPNELCGTYLHCHDGTIYSTSGGLRAWNTMQSAWEAAGADAGTVESMRVGDGLLEFGNRTVKYIGRSILGPPAVGSYQKFFYANGQLCFYHVNRGEGGYRPYANDKDGFSKLYACPWTPNEGKVDLAKAIVMTLPVVGETTFAWGQLGKQIVTGSNIGGFYVFEDKAWRKLLEPNLKVSYQVYSTLAFGDRLLMGQYPTGRLFEYDGKSIRDLAGWPPKLEGVSGSAREAQTTVLYGGEVFVGVWPWGELWRCHPDSRTWTFIQRLFDHPALSDKIVHPYDVENKNGDPVNQWGQRVTSLIPNGVDLYIATSAKSPCEWDEKKFPFLAPDKWKSYGAVYRMTMLGHLEAAAKWTDGPTRIKFALNDVTMAITQDDKPLAASAVSGAWSERLRGMKGLKNVKWGDGIYGRFNGTISDKTATGP